MTDSKKPVDSKPCECGSGFKFSQCCGVEGRTALTADVFAYVSQKGVTSEDNLTVEMQQAIYSVIDSPDLFPARVNLFEGKAWFVKMSPTTYRESVFLDPARIKGTCLIETDLDWLHDVCEKIRWQPTSFIFHSAFCGSTLVSQILDKVFNCLSLREPELLNSMLIYNRSQASAEDKSFWFDSLQRLLSRRFTPDQPVVVKANDFSNPVMLDLMGWDPEVPILFMYTPLKEFVVGCLKADNRREWIRQRYDSVKPLLSAVFDAKSIDAVEEADYGQLAAVYWSYNIALYLQVAENLDAHVCSLDFNDMLASPYETVNLCGKMFGLKQQKNVDFTATVDELMGVYSKNSKLKYSPEKRVEELKKQSTLFANEQASGEKIARVLLGKDYPERRLPRDLIVR